MGQPCSFYHEGGHGENYWARGWRYGFIREDPIKGRHKGWLRIEIPVDRWGYCDGLDGTGRKAGYFPIAHDKVWVNAFNVNEPGDYFYHGPKLHEVVQEREEKKAEDIAAKAPKPEKKYVPAKPQPKLKDTKSQPTKTRAKRTTPSVKRTKRNP